MFPNIPSKGTVHCHQAPKGIENQGGRTAVPEANAAISIAAANGGGAACVIRRGIVCGGIIIVSTRNGSFAVVSETFW